MGRPVYAVPGPIGGAASAGANALIASGRAKVLTGATMLLEALGARTIVATTEKDELATRVLDALAAAPADPDTLARRLGISGPALRTVSARLLVRGQIVTTQDGRLARR
jgi:predicted Rossmann fold nucleotide-binding protein DprA/Smf involved in DNA uptake